MDFPPLSRATLIDTVRTAVEPLPFVRCLWEGGSASFQRHDEWSDVDLQCEVDDDKVGAVFAAVEAALANVAEVSLRFVVPEPTWHGHGQRFYRFANAEPWLMLDLVVIKASAAYKFNEPALHGAGTVFFDRSGLFGAKVVSTDLAALEQRLRGRLQMLRTRVAMFEILVAKEEWRDHPIDALNFYQSLVIAPLVELLRIKHDPIRHGWANRYLHRTLPAPDAERLAALMYVGSFREIPANRQRAVQWFTELADELDRRPKLVTAS